jgi:thymidylate synthase ThyX
MFHAQMICSSINRAALASDPDLHHRLTTMELEYPRCVHSEFMTHQMFSRNAASSRAIPIDKTIRMVKEDPFIPIEWGVNQAGMQAHQVFTHPTEIKHRTILWMDGLQSAVNTAQNLYAAGLHKQIVNRVLEPYQWIRVIVTGNAIAWENFFHLRCSPMAEPHIRKIAYMARGVYDQTTPDILIPGTDEDHTPLLKMPGDESISCIDSRKVSTGRCARVSYLTHHGKRDPEADMSLHDKLVHDGHWSPFEHVAIPNQVLNFKRGGNFGPWWTQYRKMFGCECCTQAARGNPEIPSGDEQSGIK